jgi:hypothetical protein
MNYEPYVGLRASVLKKKKKDKKVEYDGFRRSLNMIQQKRFYRSTRPMPFSLH